MVKLYYALSTLALIGAANAHTRVWGIWVKGAFQGDGRNTYIRSPPSESPVVDVTSNDIICNVNNVAVPSSVKVDSGDKVAFEWYHANRGDDIIDPTHKGPLTVYIAPLSSNGAGGVWTKLWESGLTAGVWATDTLIKNGGKQEFTLPSGLAAGDYLLRTEVIALHAADTDYITNHDRGAQFYPSCAQIKVGSGGSLTPPGIFNFIGGYTHNDPGILFNLFYPVPSSYPIPGPAVWDGTSGGSSNPAPDTTPTTTPINNPVATTPTTTSTKPPATTPPTNPPATPVTTPTSVPTDYYYPPGTTPAATPTTPTSNGSCPPVAQQPVSGIVPKYYQCGGANHDGPTVCVDGTICKPWNKFYSQCVDPSEA